VHSEPKDGSSGRRFGRLRPSPALLVAGCALLVAGTSVGAAATGLINGSKIKNGTITGAKIRNHTITANKLSRGVLRTYRFILTPAEEAFYFNDPADSAYGYVNGTSLSQRGSGITAFSNPYTGVYCFTAGAAPHIASVSPDFYNDTSSEFTMTDVELNSSATNCPGAFEVDTFHVSTVYNNVANSGIRSATVRSVAARKKR
jgi:hypothetical protein